MKSPLIFAVVGLCFAFSVADADTLTINGAGATFPYPLYSKWFSEFRKVDPAVELNYQSIGSGGGIRQLLDKTIDFGASDAPMTDEQLSKASSPVIHVPTVLGAVVVTYNLDAQTGALQLTGEVIAEIFLGKITKWNDAKIVSLNKTAKLPDLPIVVIHRSDGSGTTAVFADYLAKISPEWKTGVGVGSSLKWPTGLGGKGNEGVTGLIKQTPGAVGYTELTYATTNKMPVAAIRNKAGQFVAPTPASVTAAASSAVKNMPADFRVSITDADGKTAYPISSFTYLLSYKTLDSRKGPKFVQFLEWALGDGQKLAEPLSYAPLPKELVSKVRTRIKELR